MFVCVLYIHVYTSVCVCVCMCELWNVVIFFISNIRYDMIVVYMRIYTVQQKLEQNPKKIFEKSSFTNNFDCYIYYLYKAQQQPKK
jgi:hypothetical protein